MRLSTIPDMQQLVNDEEFVKYVINRCIPFPEILRMVDDTYNYADYDKNVFCAFHESNHNTTNARLYKNPDGDTMFCYVCRKVFRPSDVITKGLVNFRLESIFYKIWKQLDSTTQDALYNAFKDRLDIVNSSWTEHLEEFDKFKKGEIDITELRNLILQYV